MESVIKWRTGEPKEEGFYLVTFCFLNNHKKGITKAEWYNKHWFIGLNYPQEEIIAWCKLSDIEPYKEETK